MSKQSVLNIKNINLFANSDEKIEFSLSKSEKVQADYSAYDKAKNFDLRGVRAKSKAGEGYIRLVLSQGYEQGRHYYQGALFKNKKKETEKSPDFLGSFTIEEGIKVAVAGWIKMGEKSGKYLSLAISEFKGDKTEAKPESKSTSSTAPARDAFDMDDDHAPAPAAKSKPPAKSNAATDSNDPDWDIPF